MTTDKKKVALGLGLVTGIGLLFYGISKAMAKPEPPEEAGAAIQIEIIGAESHSPAVLEEGGSYIVRLTIKNFSTKAGVPWDASLTTAIVVGGAYHTLIPTQARTDLFGAGQTKTFDYPINVPIDIGGQTGNIIANVSDPSGVVLADAIEYYDIITIEIIYGATIGIGV